MRLVVIFSLMASIGNYVEAAVLATPARGGAGAVAEPPTPFTRKTSFVGQLGKGLKHLVGVGVPSQYHPLEAEYAGLTAAQKQQFCTLIGTGGYTDDTVLTTWAAHMVIVKAGNAVAAPAPASTPAPGLCTQAATAGTPAAAPSPAGSSGSEFGDGSPASGGGHEAVASPVPTPAPVSVVDPRSPVLSPQDLNAALASAADNASGGSSSAAVSHDGAGEMGTGSGGDGSELGEVGFMAQVAASRAAVPAASAPPLGAGSAQEAAPTIGELTGGGAVTPDAQRNPAALFQGDASALAAQISGGATLACVFGVAAKAAAAYRKHPRDPRDGTKPTYMTFFRDEWVRNWGKRDLSMYLKLGAIFGVLVTGYSSLSTK